MSRAEELARELIEGDKRAKRLFLDAGQLRAGGDRVQAFMLQATQSAGGLLPDLLSYFELLYALVKGTDRFPFDAEYLLSTPRGELILDAYGNAAGQVPAGADLLPGPEAPGDGDAPGFMLDGLDSVEAEPISGLFRAFAEGRINKLCCRAFAEAPARLAGPWKLELLRSFYTASGSARWIPPVDDIAAAERRLAKLPDAQRFRDQALRAMADAGKMGFCPAQYLRRVLIPLLDASPGDYAAFERSSSAVADCFLSVCAEMGPDGDGSANNLFTLKALIAPLAALGSRLSLPGWRDDPAMPSMEEVLFSLGRRWAALFKKRHPFTRELLRSYADHFLAGIARIETPREVLRQGLRLLEHVEFVSGRALTDADFQRFRKPLHARGVRLLLARAERDARYANLLRVLQKHFDTVERLVLAAEAKAIRERRAPGRYSPFSSPEYLSYLRFFAAGSFATPGDIEVFFDVLHGLRGAREGDTDDMVSIVLENAKDPAERADLIAFLKECPVFDRAVYAAWRGRSESGRSELVEGIRGRLRAYLEDPLASTAHPELPGLDDRLEIAFIKQLVRSAQLTKPRVEEILVSGAVRGDDPVPPELAQGKRFHVRERAPSGEEEGGGKNAHRDFLRARLALLKEAIDSATDADWWRPRAKALLAAAGERSAALAELSRQTEALIAQAPEGERAALERKRRGLEEQGAGFRAAASFLRSVAGPGEEPPEVPLKAAALALACDKTIAKARFPDAFLFLLALGLGEEAADALASEPFATIAEADPQAPFLGFALVAAMREASTTFVRQAVAGFFEGPFKAMPPSYQAQARAMVAAAAGSPEDNNDAMLADLAYRRYGAQAANHFLDRELDSLGGPSGGRASREILLVAGKRRLDQFYGFVGELCIAQHVQELRRRDFFPVRIVDLASGRLVGYVHLFVYQARIGLRQLKLAVLGGVEPKSSWLAYVDEVDFHCGVRRAAVEWARALGASMLCSATGAVAMSNCMQLSRAMQVDIEGKPLVEPEKPLSFPQGYWTLSPLAVLWSATSGPRGG